MNGLDFSECVMVCGFMNWCVSVGRMENLLCDKMCHVQGYDEPVGSLN